MIKPIYSFLLLLIFTTSCNGQNKQDADSSKAPSKGNPESIFFQSSDNGATWQDLTSLLPDSMQISCTFAQDGEIFLGSGKGILYHSSNPKSGIWEKEVVSNIFPNEMITGIFKGPSGLYASISQMGFFRKKSGTHIWQPLYKTLPDNIINTVLENPDGTIFVACPNGIYRSKDDCKTWKQVLKDDWITSLTSLNNILVCSGSKGLFRSTNDGENWDSVLNDNGSIYNTKIINGRFFAIRVAGPWLSPVDYLPQCTFTSSDNGKTWQPFDRALLEEQRIYDLAAIGEYIFCSNKMGISRSTDGGKNWQLMNTTILGKSKRFELVVLGHTVFAIVINGGGC